MELNEYLRRPASDFMVTDVETLRPDHTLAHAAYKFLHFQISGAPVLDDVGKCVGVLSVTDVVSAADKVATLQAKVTDEFFAHSNLLLPSSAYESRLSGIRDKLMPAAEQPVSNFMVTDLVTVVESDPLEQVIRNLVDAHLHRVIVIDDQGMLRGLISTLDVMAGLLNVPVKDA